MRVPDLLLMCYPALNLEVKYTPCSVYAFQDLLLNYGTLQIANRLYLCENSDPFLDYYLSPGNAPDW